MDKSIYSPYYFRNRYERIGNQKKGFPEHYLWVGPTEVQLSDVRIILLICRLLQIVKLSFVTCGTQLYWAKNNLIYQTKLLAKSHPECQFFVTLGLGEQEFQCQKLMDNVSVVSYLPYNEYIPQMDYVIHHGGSGIFFPMYYK